MAIAARCRQPPSEPAMRVILRFESVLGVRRVAAVEFTESLGADAPIARNVGRCMGRPDNPDVPE